MDYLNKNKLIAELKDINKYSILNLLHAETNEFKYFLHYRKIDIPDGNVNNYIINTLKEYKKSINNVAINILNTRDDLHELYEKYKSSIVSCLKGSVEKFKDKYYKYPDGILMSESSYNFLLKELEKTCVSSDYFRINYNINSFYIENGLLGDVIYLYDRYMENKLEYIIKVDDEMLTIYTDFIFEIKKLYKIKLDRGYYERMYL